MDPCFRKSTTNYGERKTSLLLSWKGKAMRAHSKVVMVKVKKRDRCIARSEVESV